MKKNKIIFWIVTGLFSAYMLFSSIPNVLSTTESVAFMNYLGYPDYFVPFIGIAKVLGIIAILVPGYPRIKEWAYAGLFFDLAGATYSVSVVAGIHPEIVFMVLPIVFLFLSYFLYHRIRKTQAA